MTRMRETESVGLARARGCSAFAFAAVSVLLCSPAVTGLDLPEAAATTPSASSSGPVTAADVLAEVRASRGSVVLVNVWATWCVPCREEFPDLLRLQRELGVRGLRLVLVSADLASQRPQVEVFLKKAGVDFRTFQEAQADQDFIDGLERRWSGALPVTLLFDRHGKEVGFWEGGSTYSELLARVRPLLNGS
jgi:thiol-disulfide isomerase/thioredoxin